MYKELDIMRCDLCKWLRNTFHLVSALYINPAAVLWSRYARIMG